MVTYAFKQSGICLLFIFSLCGLSTCNLNDQYFSSKYLIPSHRLSFFEAVEWCRQKDMQLVELYSDIKNKEVLEYLQSSEHWLWDVDSHVSFNKKTSYWTAGYFFLNDPTWRWWSDGREMRYFNWDLISPHNDTKSEYCMAAYNPWNTDELKWRDDNCSYRKHFICEYPSNVVAKPLVINENCYYISQMKLSIFESKQFCHEQSMRLVNISGEEKQNDILRVLRDSGRVDTGVTLNEFWAIDTDNEPIVIYDNGYALIKDDRPTPYEQNFFICEGIEMEVNQKKSSNYNVENKKYYVSDEMANYEEAFERCISKGMELLSIEDADKNQAVHRELSRRGYRNSIEFWSSGNKLPLNSASWTWGKGSKVRYTHWNYGEPNNSTERENCIQVYNNPDTMGWNDIRCEKRMKYICESSTPRVNLFCIKYVSGHIIDDEINQIIF